MRICPCRNCNTFLGPISYAPPIRCQLLGCFFFIVVLQMEALRVQGGLTAQSTCCLVLSIGEHEFAFVHAFAYVQRRELEVDA